MNIDNSKLKYSLSMLEKDREDYCREFREDSRFYDKTLISLSAGGLVLSITLVNLIMPDPIPSSLNYLFMSWGAFALAFISIMVCSLLGAKSHLSDINKIERQMHCCLDAIQTSDEGTKGQFARRAEEIRLEKNVCSVICGRLTGLSLFAFLLGVLSLALFSFSNLNGKVNSSNAKLDAKNHVLSIAPLKVQ